MRANTLARIACFAAFCIVPAYATGSCDANCICDGFDLSPLADMSYNTVVEDATGKILLGHTFKVSICEPLTADELKDSSCDAKKQSRIVVYKRSENKTDTGGHDGGLKDCEYVGDNVVSAVTEWQKKDGIRMPQKSRLVFASGKDGESHIVVANIECDHDAGAGGAPDPATYTLVDGVHTYEFDWQTEKACEPPKQACDQNCVCAGLDLSLLDGTFKDIVGQDKNEHALNGWLNTLSVCKPIPQQDKDASCPHSDANILQFPAPAAQNSPGSPNRTGCNAIGQTIDTARIVLKRGILGVDLVFSGQEEAQDGEELNFLEAGLGDGSQGSNMATTTVVGHLTCDMSGGMGSPIKMTRFPPADGVDDHYEFDWPTESVCDEKRPRGRPSTSKVRCHVLYHP